MYDDLLDIFVTVLVIAIALWAVIGLGLYPRSGRLWDHFADYLAQRGTPLRRMIGAVDAMPRTPGEIIWARWIRQGLALAALLCLVSGVSRFLDRYHLIIDGHSQVVAGGSFADVHFFIPAYGLVVVCWIATAFIIHLLCRSMERPTTPQRAERRSPPHGELLRAHPRSDAAQSVELRMGVAGRAKRDS